MKLIPLLALLALAACATVPPGGSAGPTAAIGEVATVGGLHVRPIELLEDSRCPASVQCVWAGQVRVLVEVTRSDGAHQQRDLTLGRPQDIDWGWLALADAAPAKRAPGQIDPRAYRFTFTLAPGP
jgi:hypothetical protein